MTHLDEKALAAKAWADLEFAASAAGAVEVANVTLPIEKVRALVNERSAIPSSPVSELVEEWRKAMEGVTPGPWETTGGSVTDFGREWPGSLSMEFIPNGYDEEINVRHKADAAWMARCSPDRIDALITTISTRIAELEREVKRLRYIVHECANALGNGAYIDPNCSIEFMEILPVEIRSVVRGLSLSTSPQGGDYA